MTRRLLLIAYYYPPHPAIASNRMEALACGLIHCGWDVTVITATYPGRKIYRDGCNVMEVVDPGVLRGVKAFLKRGGTKQPAKAIFNSTTYPELWSQFSIRKLAYELLCFPDTKKNWRRPVLEACRNAVKSGTFDVVLTSFSPATSHVIGHQVKSSGMAKRWVADFRDLWTQNHYREGQVSVFRNWSERSLEKRIVSNADLLVTISSPLAETLGKLHPNKPIEVVTNGFVPLEHPEISVSSQFTIVYTGQLYQGRRDPSVLFEAVRLMKQKGYCEPGEIRISFLGDNPSWLETLANIHQVTEEVKLFGQVPREQALKAQREATILLTLNWDHPLEAGTFTGKVFEYLQAKRPILAVGGPPGVLSHMLEKTEAGRHANCQEDVVVILKDWMSEFRRTGNVEFCGIPEEVNQYSWAYLIQRYNSLLERLCHRHV